MLLVFWRSRFYTTTESRLVFRLLPIGVSFVVFDGVGLLHSALMIPIKKQQRKISNCGK
jgi:hypothetical protein